MSTEWQVPAPDNSQQSKRRRLTYAVLGVLVAVVMAIGGYLALGLGGGGNHEGGDVLLGSGLNSASLDDAAMGTTEPTDTVAGSSEAATATESTAETTTSGAPTATDDLDLSIDEEALVFDSSYVTGIAAAVSQQVFPDGGADNVILASDMPSGDALAAGSLIGLFDTTLLLTDTEELSPITATEIDRLGNPRVHILGGADVVSPEVEAVLVEAGHDVHRHAGPRQAHTAVDIAGAHFTDARTAVLVRTPDRTAGPVQAISSALAATSLAAAQDLPILLTEGGALNDTTESYLEGSFIRQLIVVGNEDEISPEVTSRLRELGIDWLRWSGTDRFDTAVQVANNRGFQSLDDADVVVLVEGGHDSVWPAGFLGTVQASHENGPAVLTDGDTIPTATADYLATATPGEVDVVCTPGVTRRACATAMAIIDGDASG